MLFYGLVGESIETTDETKSPKCPDGYIVMKGPRPTTKHIANEFGEWVLPPEKVGESDNEQEAKENAS